MDYIKRQLWLTVVLLSIIFVALSVTFFEIIRSHHLIKIFHNITIFFIVFVVVTLLVIFVAYDFIMKSLLKKIYSQQERINLINRLYRTLSRINRLIIVAENREELLKKACKVFVEEGGFKFAWAGVYKDGRLNPVACEGPAEYIKESEKVLSSLLSSLDTMPGEKLRKGEIFVIENVENEDEPWVKTLLKLEYKSAAYIPIKDNGNIKAVIGIYSDKPLVINDPEEERLLKEIRDDLSFAFDMITRIEFERLLIRAFEHSKEMIIITDKDSNILFANPAVKDIMGFDPKELVGKKTAICKPAVTSEKDLEEFHKKIKEGKAFPWLFVGRKPNGEIYHLEEFVAPVISKSGEVTHFVLTGRDITRERSLQERLRDLIYNDPVTGLPNKLYLQEMLEAALEKARVRKEKVALFYVDIWGFSEINSTFGFDRGDQVLIEVSQRLKRNTGADSIVARIGGDEFAILIEGIKVDDEIRYWISKIFDAFREPFQINGDEVYLDLNIGIAVFPDGSGEKDLISQADAALKDSKRDGAGSYRFFTEEMTQKMGKKLILDNRLREAVKNMDFMLFYQPQVDLNNGEIIGFEALLRWSDEKLGWVSPAEFVPELEALGLISEVGEWVLFRAASDLEKFIKIKDEFRMAINLSPYQLRKDILLEGIVKRVENSGVSPDHFAFEITESALMSNIDEIKQELDILRDKGIMIDIDDFGTGYSSLSYLKKLPIDHLKIDRSFIIDIPGNRDSEAIVRAIVTMAKELDIGIIAEGIETREQLNFLKNLGVDRAQGFFFSKPVPLEDALNLLKSNQDSPFEV